MTMAAQVWRRHITSLSWSLLQNPSRSLPATSRYRSYVSTQCLQRQFQRRHYTTPATAEVPTENVAMSLEDDQRSSSEGKTVINDKGLPFSSLKDKVSKETLKAITVKPMKLTHMTPVQEAILPLLPGLAEPFEDTKPGEERPAKDLLVKAKTGTGKTLAFLVPAIEARHKAIEAHVQKVVRDAGLVSDKALEARARRQFTHLQVGTLIISPTRELATQIANEAIKLSHHTEFEVRLFVGGLSKRTQMRDFVKGRRDFIVATPGRMRDLLESEEMFRDALKTCQHLILDEADTLLEMGFRDDLDAITDHLPPPAERQTFLFSATVPRAVEQVARQTLNKNHTFVNAVSEDSSPVHAHVPQFHTVLPSATEQIPHILRLIAHDQLIHPGGSKIIVFLPTTKMTALFATLIRELSRTILPAQRQTKVYEMHSKRTMEARMNTSDSFRKDTSGAAILVTSDVSARGVDYPGVTRIIQVGIPGSTEQYIHRVGRTGRGKDLVGRGDMVLLPWEIGFLSWQLQEVPLKPLTINELKKEVSNLAEQFDENPQAIIPSMGTGSRYRSIEKKPVSPAIEKLDTYVQELLSSLDEEAIEQTFASLLGYYIAKSPELRAQKDVIVQGIKDWSVQACGLPQAPYVSQQFLARLGMKDGRTKHWGKDRHREGRKSSGPSWAGRGQQRLKGQDRQSDWDRPRGEMDPNDPGNPDEYRGSRYGRERSNRERPLQLYSANGRRESESGDRRQWNNNRAGRDRGDRGDRGERRSTFGLKKQ